MSRTQTTFRGRQKKAKRTYAPTTAELNEAIEDYLHENPKATTDQIRASLVKAHETWQIPERRLNKFVKRQKTGKPMTDDDDKSLASRGPGHRLKGFFTIKSSSSSSAPKKVEKVPPVVVKNPESAPPKKLAVVEEPAPVVAEPKVEVVDKAAAYVDDNDGSTGGPCAACDGCTIL